MKAHAAENGFLSLTFPAKDAKRPDSEWFTSFFSREKDSLLLQIFRASKTETGRVRTGRASVLTHTRVPSDAAQNSARACSQIFALFSSLAKYPTHLCKSSSSLFAACSISAVKPLRVRLSFS